MEVATITKEVKPKKHPNSEHFFFVVGFVLLLLLVVVAALLLLLLVVQGQVKVSRVNKIQLTRIN